MLACLSHLMCPFVCLFVRPAACAAKQSPHFTCLFLQTHLPGYITDYDKIKAKGVDVIACVSVNDAFVMAAWGDENKTTGKVQYVP